MKNSNRSNAAATQIETFLSTANGRIYCRRCLARSTRTGLQCARPALKLSKSQRCQFHGGAPHTVQSLQLIVEANFIHGNRSKAGVLKDRQTAILIRELADAVNVLKLGQVKKLRGRRPKGYKPIVDQSGVVELVNQKLIHMISRDD